MVKTKNVKIRQVKIKQHWQIIQWQNKSFFYSIIIFWKKTQVGVEVGWGWSEVAGGGVRDGGGEK